MNITTRFCAMALMGLAGAGLSSPAMALWLGNSADSVWQEGKLSIDGKASDWKVDDVTDEDGLTYAFSNDNKNLYIYVSPHTTKAKRLLSMAYRQNFTIWVDTAAGKGENVGIKMTMPARKKRGETSSSSYSEDGQSAPPQQPDGEGESGMGGQPPDMQGNGSSMRGGFSGDESSGQDSRSESSGRSRGGMEMKAGIIEYLGISSETAKGFADEQKAEVKVGSMQNRGILEIRLPYSLFGGILPGKISVGFAADKLAKMSGGPGGQRGGQDSDSSGGQMRGGPGGGMGGGPGGGMRGGPGGGMGGGPGGGSGGGMGGAGQGGGPGGQQQESDSDDDSALSLWVRVKLAAAPSK